ncbi:MAG: DUF4132 domain-containing protein, partial [Pseudomonadota bacterium]
MEQALQLAHRDLKLALVRLPNMWIPTGAEHPEGEWSDLTHQIFPYFSEIGRYRQALRDAAPMGTDISGHMACLTSLCDTAERNLRALASGNFKVPKLRDVIAAFPAGEELRLSDPLGRVHLTDAKRAFLDDRDRIDAKTILQIEARYMLHVRAELENIASKLPKDGLDALIVELTPAGDAAKPSQAWIKKAKAKVDDATLEKILALIATTGPKVQEEFRHTLGDTGGYFDALQNWETYRKKWRTLLWIAHLAGPKAQPVLFDFALKAYAKRPGVGITNEKLGNAAAVSLSLMDETHAAAQLLRLHRRVAYSSVKKRLSKMIDGVAERAGLSRIDLEELCVADHGFARGQKRIPLQGGAAVLICKAGKITVQWEDQSGNPRKSLPKAVKDNDPSGVKAVKDLVKEIQTDVLTCKDRLEALYLRDVSWDFETWRKRYVDHGTLSVLARDLLWTAQIRDSQVTV